MLGFLAVLVVVFFLMTFLGFMFHWAFHQPWSGRFYKAHLNHHTIQYPPEDYLSDKYRDAGKDNTAYLFALCFSPIILTILALGLFHIIPFGLSLLIIFEMSIIGLMNDYLHEHFHLTSSFYDKFPYFHKLRKLHYLHHVDMTRNFGIFMFMWDKLFKVYTDQ